MSDEPETTDAGGTVWDAPNQQVVREDGSPPWEEGAGGGGNPDPQSAHADGDLEAMTKAELLDYAKSLGVSPANNDMTKAELIDAVEAHQG